MTTYNEDEFNAALQAGIAQAVQAAVAPLQAELDDFKATQADETIEARIAQIQADADAAVAEVQAKLDVAEVQSSTMTEELENLKAYLTAEAETQAQAALETSRRDDRLAAAAEFNFPEDHVNANVERWVSMDDDAFAQAVEEWRSVAALAKAQVGAPAVPATAMSTTRSTAETTPAQGLAALAGLREKGINLGNL